MAKKKATTKEKDFPLTLRADGRYCKKCRGKVYIFGADKQKALERWAREKDYLLAGLPVPATVGGEIVTLRNLANEWLVAEQKRATAGEIGIYHFNNLRRAAAMLLDVLGKNRAAAGLGPADFTKLREAIIAKYSPEAATGVIKRIVGLFRWSVANQWLDKLPNMNGQFSRPSATVVRRHRAKKGEMVFRRAELTGMLAVADARERALLFVALNCGLGNQDVSDLRQDMITDGWLKIARGKTGVERLVPLWPETLEAIAEAVPKRRVAALPRYEPHVFLARDGMPLIRDGKTERTDRVRGKLRKLANKAGVDLRNRGFYSLRRSFAHVADATGDRAAVAAVLGHLDSSQSAIYVGTIARERLQRAVEAVRTWLFGEKPV